ncbi:MAG: hypothetical protein JXX14_05935, partial [Deltaproteobacteria bacterium]|nr:hypothetical protein [Deltaproteobacteria bacterium]
MVTGVMGPTPGHAQADRPAAARVVLVHLDTCCPAAAWPEVDGRIQTELALRGLDLSHTIAKGHGDRSYLDILTEAMRLHAARGAILVAVTPDNGAVLHSVFVAAESDVSEYRQYPLVVEPAGTTAEVAALKAGEAVLAALYPQSRAAGDGGAPLSPAVAVPDKMPRESDAPRSPAPVFPNSRYRLSTAVHAGVAWAPGGLGPMGVGGRHPCRVSDQPVFSRSGRRHHGADPKHSGGECIRVGATAAGSVSAGISAGPQRTSVCRVWRTDGDGTVSNHRKKRRLSRKAK